MNYLLKILSIFVSAFMIGFIARGVVLGYEMFDQVLTIWMSL